MGWDRQRRVVLVTGASSGIGLATASLLAERGFVVYAAARRAHLLEPLRELGATPLTMDVTDEQQVVGGIERIIAEQGRIDALVNNAGVGVLGPVEVVDLEQVRRQFEVNLFAGVRLAQLVVPHMRAQGGGHIVNMSSIGSHYSMPLIGWYHASKFALRAISVSMRKELAQFGIHVSTVEPGPTLSEWSGVSREELVERTRGTLYEHWGLTLRRTLEVGDVPVFSAPAEAVARYVLKALESPRPRRNYVVGLQARLMPALHYAMHPRLLDAILDVLRGPVTTEHPSDPAPSPSRERLFTSRERLFTSRERQFGSTEPSAPDQAPARVGEDGGEVGQEA